MSKNIFHQKGLIGKSLALTVLLSLTACSKVDSALDTKNGVSYHDNKSIKVLKSPEGLVAPEYDMTFALPETDISSKNQTLVDIRPPDLTQ
jgi:uncharacterized lipoprotein